MDHPFKYFCTGCGTGLVLDAKYCSRCASVPDISNIFCNKCGTQLTKDEEACLNCGAVLGEKQRTNNNNSNQTEQHHSYNFKTLLMWGNFTSGVGWSIFLLSVISLFISFANMRTFGSMVLIGAVFMFTIGVLMVVNGQLISCFVSNERNTKKIKELLEQHLQGGKK